MWKQMDTVLRRLILSSDLNEKQGLAYWQNEFFYRVSRLVTIASLIILPVSIFSYVQTADYGMILPVFTFAILFLVMSLAKRLQDNFRRFGLVLLFCMVGVYLLIQAGYQGSSLIFLFSHPILAAIFFGKGKAQISLWFNGVFLIIVNAALYLYPQFQNRMADYSTVKWVTISVTFLFLSAVITNAINHLVDGLHKTLRAEITTRTALESEIAHRITLEEALQKERESLQVRVDERTSLLAKANEDLMRSMKFKDAFFDSIRHEFRTPIHAISGYTDLLFAKRENLNEKQINYLERIRESADHLLGVINNILDTTRIQAGMLDIQPVVLSLNEICKNSLAYVEGDAIRKGVTIVPVNCDEKVNINADPQRFKQVLINLLENSVKYTPEGGAMGINMDHTDQEVCLTVWDTGIGIPDADINNIFEPFYRSENRNVQDVEGTGLGLSLAKQLIEAHDWKLTVDSELGKGSRFTIHIPMRDVTDHNAVIYY